MIGVKLAKKKKVCHCLCEILILNQTALLPWHGDHSTSFVCFKGLKRVLHSGDVNHSVCVDNSMS